MEAHPIPMPTRTTTMNLLLVGETADLKVEFLKHLNEGLRSLITSQSPQKVISSDTHSTANLVKSVRDECKLFKLSSANLSITVMTVPDNRDPTALAAVKKHLLVCGSSIWLVMLHRVSDSTSYSRRADYWRELLDPSHRDSRFKTVFVDSTGADGASADPTRARTPYRSNDSTLSEPYSGLPREHTYTWSPSPPSRSTTLQKPTGQIELQEKRQNQPIDGQILRFLTDCSVFLSANWQTSTAISLKELPESLFKAVFRSTLENLISLAEDLHFGRKELERLEVFSAQFGDGDYSECSRLAGNRKRAHRLAIDLEKDRIAYCQKCKRFCTLKYDEKQKIPQPGLSEAGIGGIAAGLGVLAMSRWATTLGLSALGVGTAGVGIVIAGVVFSVTAALSHNDPTAGCCAHPLCEHAKDLSHFEIQERDDEVNRFEALVENRKSSIKEKLNEKCQEIKSRGDQCLEDIRLLMKVLHLLQRTKEDLKVFIGDLIEECFSERLNFLMLAPQSKEIVKNLISLADSSQILLTGVNYSISLLPDKDLRNMEWESLKRLQESDAVKIFIMSEYSDTLNSAEDISL